MRLLVFCYFLALITFESLAMGQTRHTERAKHYFNLLKDLPEEEVKEKGRVCEHLARFQLSDEFPAAEFELISNVVYQLDGQAPQGELDLLVVEKSSSQVVLVVEVKCRSNEKSSLKKAKKQLARFACAVSRSGESSDQVLLSQRYDSRLSDLSSLSDDEVFLPHLGVHSYSLTQDDLLLDVENLHVCKDFLDANSLETIVIHSQDQSKIFSMDDFSDRTEYRVMVPNKIKRQSTQVCPLELEMREIEELTLSLNRLSGIAGDRHTMIFEDKIDDLLNNMNRRKMSFTVNQSKKNKKASRLLLKRSLARQVRCLY